ncbi:MAG: hypothetical protein QOG72_2466 [Sphingomonadales bacterium]|nr:hypothetical protein [Sphingomonadales bacterium]
MSDPWAPPSREDVRAASAGTPKAEPPGPGFFGSIGPGFRRARAAEDWGLNQMNYEGRVLADIEAEARKRGTWHMAPRARTREDALAYGADHDLGDVEDERENSLMAWYQAERSRDPRLLPQYATIHDREGLRRFAVDQRRTDVGRADAELRGGSTAGQVAGALGAGFLDPTSYIPVGGPALKGLTAARMILSVAGREAAANAGLTLALEPFTREDAASLGVERGARETLIDTGVSGLTGGVLGGAGKTLDLGVHAITARRAGTAAERQLLALMDAGLPEERRTPGEQAAANVVQRHAEVLETSPFERSPAGDDVHAARLGAAYGRVTRGTSPPSPVSSAGAREQLKSRIRRVEEGDGYNEASGAMGPYQFLASTWRSYYVRRYGRGGLSDAQIAAKRRDPALNDVLMNDLVADNAAMLRDAGQPETAGSLYLLHFAGPDGLKVLRAAPDTPVAQLLKPLAIEKNRFLKGMSAADLVEWADRKMGAPGETRPKAGETAERAAGEDRSELDEVDDLPPLPAEREAAESWSDDVAMLRVEDFATPEEHAATQFAVQREAGENPIEYGSREHPTEAMLSNREFAAPATMEEAAERLQARVQRIVDAGERYEALPYNERVLLNASRHAGIELSDGKGKTRSVAAIARDLTDGGDLTTVLREEIGTVAGRKGWLAEAAKERPEIFTGEYRDEVRAFRREHGPDAVTTGEHLRDRILARREGKPPPPAVRLDTATSAPPTGELARFDAPDGEGAALQVESLLHDLRMDAEAGDKTAIALLEETDGELTFAATLRGCL